MISELKRPASNLPLAIIISLIIVIFIYILTSVSYFAILPLDVLNNPDAAIGKEVGQHAFGAAGCKKKKQGEKRKRKRK